MSNPDSTHSPEQPAATFAAAPGCDALPPLEGGLKEILGMICIHCAPIARRLHSLGIYDVKTRAEDEQAATLHWLINLYLKHGAEWRTEAEKILKGEAQHNV